MDERPLECFDPAGAGAVLTVTMGASAGSGALVGIPAGAFAAYRRFCGYFLG